MDAAKQLDILVRTVEAQGEEVLLRTSFARGRRFGIDTEYGVALTSRELWWVHGGTGTLFGSPPTFGQIDRRVCGATLIEGDRVILTLGKKEWKVRLRTAQDARRFVDALGAPA